LDAKLIVNVLNMIQAAFTWLANRGITKDRIQAILDDANGGDVSTEVVQAELDALASELDTTAGMIQP
jgi:hypothetical protein